MNAKNHKVGLYKRLAASTPEQMDDVQGRLGLAEQYLPPRDAAAVTRAVKILALAEQRPNGLNQLQKILDQVYGDRAVARKRRHGISRSDRARQASQLAEAEKVLETEFKRLPDFEPEWLWMGSRGSSTTKHRDTVFRKADDQLVRFDQGQSPRNPRKTARYFVKVAIYWRSVLQELLAVQRLERARALDPKSVEAHGQLGQTLAYVASETPPGVGKAVILHEARVAIERAAELQRGHDSGTLHDRGWILDEEGLYDAAIDCYREALRFDKRAGRRESPAIRYNLACALAKGGRHPEALVELRKAVTFGEYWKWAERDSDLDALRRSKAHGAAFRRLIDDAKSRRRTADH